MRYILLGLFLLAACSTELTPIVPPEQQWGVMLETCSTGGYEIDEYEGVLLAFETSLSDKAFDGEPVNLIKVYHKETLICEYYAVRPGSHVAPGIYPI